MNTLYVITKYLTFPGAMVRGLFEHLMCRICSLPVEDNRLMQKDELCSHVEHELAPTARKAFALCFVPAFLNAIIATLLAITSTIGLFYFEQTGIVNIIISVLAYWIAFSLYVNSYPLIEDALNMKDKIYNHGTLLQKIIYAPGFLGCYIGAFLERYCITFLLALAGLVALILF